MRQIVFPLLFLALAAQSQVQTHGVPASVTSPGTDGRLHGVPSSVTSPTPVGVPRTSGLDHSRVLMGNPRHRRRSEVVPVPVFYPVYVNSASTDPVQPVDESSADQADLDAASGAGADALREAYARGAQDALSEIRSRRSSASVDQSRDRSADRSADKSGEKPKSRVKEDSESTESRQAPEVAAQPEPPTQPTIFIFRDGHRLETQNYAIVGQTLFDFSAKPLRKIKIAELDVDATRKVNDEAGSSVNLP
jgi:hypothetical protein